jgi:MFS family permease
MADAPSSPQTTAEDQYRTAIEGYRNVIKWVLSSFAAVAGALIAGLQLSALGQLEGEALGWALFGVTLALGGVVAIILFAVQVLVPIGATYKQFEQSRDFEPLRKYLELDKSPLRLKASSASGLADAYDEAIEQESAARKGHEKHPSDKQLEHDLAQATAKREELYAVVVSITKLGLTLRTQELFARAMWAVRLGVVAAAVGGILFAYFANPPKTSATPVASSKVVGRCHCGSKNQAWQTQHY